MKGVRVLKKSICLDEYKELLLEILKDVDSFCQKNSIKYFLTSGTLIGAIRHKGFIPWDDDIDIAMLREDYEVFVRTYSSSKDYYKLLSLETDRKYAFPFAKVVDDRVALVENVSKRVEIGAYLDVFPIDNCPGESASEACKTIDDMNYLRTLRDLKNIRLSKKRSFWKNAILAFCKLLTIFISKRLVAELTSKKAKKNRYCECKYVAGLTNTTYGHGEIIPKECFRNVIDVEFENCFFKAPEGYDLILTSYYGDYMKLPPEEKRVSHHDFECWYK